MPIGRSSPEATFGGATTTRTGPPPDYPVSLSGMSCPHPGGPVRMHLSVAPPHHASPPRISGGSASATSFSRPVPASHSLRPAGLLNRPRRLLSRGFDRPGCPDKPLASHQALPTTAWVDPSSTGKPHRRCALRFRGWLADDHTRSVAPLGLLRGAIRSRSPKVRLISTEAGWLAIKSQQAVRTPAKRVATLRVAPLPLCALVENHDGVQANASPQGTRTSHTILALLLKGQHKGSPARERQTAAGGRRAVISHPNPDEAPARRRRRLP